MKKIRKIIKKFFRRIKKLKVKILCSITCLTLILSLFTVFSFANTVPDDDLIENVDYTYWAYPNLKGFSFDYSNTDVSFDHVFSRGYVWNTLNYIYGLEKSAWDWSDPDFKTEWADGFSFYYPDIYGNLSQRTFNITSRLENYQRDGTNWDVGEVLLWSQNFWSSSIKNYITGNNLNFYYDDFVVHRDLWRTTPFCALARYSDALYTDQLVDVTVQYQFSYLSADQDGIVSSKTAVTTNNSIDDWYYSVEEGPYDYVYINLIPYGFISDYFLQHPDEDYLYFTDVKTFITCNDAHIPGVQYGRINLYHFLISEYYQEELDISVSDYINSLPRQLDDDPILEADFTSWINRAVGSFMRFEIFPGFSFQLIFSVLIGAVLFFFFLRMFSGG